MKAHYLQKVEMPDGTVGDNLMGRGEISEELFPCIRIAAYLSEGLHIMEYALSEDSAQRTSVERITGSELNEIKGFEQEI